MSLTSPSSEPVRTAVTCSKCGKATTVPFVPTPGRPVFCRDCFQRPPAPGAAPFRGGASARGPAPAPARVPRKRMLSQGRKTHFLYDARAALADLPGGFAEKDHRSFLEGLFARGSRQSTEAAQEFLDQKATEEAITAEQRDALGRLLERYSFYR